MADRHPALKRLGALVGRWTVRPKVEGLDAAWSEFSWQDGGQFLRQYSHAGPIPDSAPQAWRENSPFPITSLIGLDDATDEFTMLYADGRGVHRVYRMTFADREWTIWRNDPGFNQRFTATMSPDGDRIDGRWDSSSDGVSWTLDFELSYVRER